MIKKDTLTEIKKHEREEEIKIELGCKFIRINPDAENYDVFVEIGKIKIKEAEIKKLKENFEKEKEAEIKKKEKLEKEKEAEIKEIKEKLEK